MNKTKKVFIGVLIALGLFTVVTNIDNGKVLAEDIIKAQESDRAKYLRGIDLVHQMSNTIIISRDIWGKEKITIKNIDKAIELIGDNDYYLVGELTEWKNSDLSNGVEVHNYVWGLLNGTVGKAHGLSDKGVEQAKKNLE